MSERNEPSFGRDLGADKMHATWVLYVGLLPRLRAVSARPPQRAIACSLDFQGRQRILGKDADALLRSRASRAAAALSIYALLLRTLDRCWPE